MQRKFGLLSLGKVSSHSMALPRFLFFFPVISVFVFLYHELKPTLIQQMDMGSLTCAQRIEEKVRHLGTMEGLAKDRTVEVDVRHQGWVA